jgi:hypothetical protein
MLGFGPFALSLSKPVLSKVEGGEQPKPAGFPFMFRPFDFAQGSTRTETWH